MSYGAPKFWKKVGFRLWLWYSCFFLATALLLFLISHHLFSAALAQRDHENIRLKLRELASVYVNEGLAGLKRNSGFFLVRAADSRNDTLLMVNAELYEDFDLDGLRTATFEEWMELAELETEDDEFQFPLEPKEALEVASRSFSDGSLLQVGKSSESRGDLLEWFHLIYGITLIPLFFIGGGLLSSRALRPLKSMISTVQSIQAGRLESRVPIRNSGDELDQLAILFNQMLDRIHHLLDGMRNSLDNVAHDLRTPITRIRAVAETALQMEPDQETYKEALEDCLEETERLLNLTNVLMDISEAETGSMKLTLETVSVPALFQDSVELYRYLAEEKNLAIQTECDAELSVVADKNRMRQVMANLLDNAIKYTDPGGHVAMEASRINGEAVIQVKDTGIGILPDELNRIWDRLYRADKTRSHKGMGLGLSLVRAVVKAHGGRVEASSVDGKGSIFSVYLPTGAP